VNYFKYAWQNLNTIKFYSIKLDIVFWWQLGYRIFTFYIENDAEIFPACYTWKVAEKGFKMAFMTNKLAINNSCEIILEK
jgi:hypothetical protein